MLVKSALLNLEAQQFFASTLPLVLLSAVLSFLPSLAHSHCHSALLLPFFHLTALVPVDFKVLDVLVAFVVIDARFSAKLCFKHGAWNTKFCFSSFSFICASRRSLFSFTNFLRYMCVYVFSFSVSFLPTSFYILLYFLKSSQALVWRLSDGCLAWWETWCLTM